MRKLVLLLLVIVFGAGGWLLYSPRHTFEELRAAAQQGDADRVDHYVDFAAVRANLKSDMRLWLRDEVRNDSDNPLLEFGVMLGGALVDRMVDAFVSPTGIASVANGERPAVDDGSRSQTVRDYEIDRKGLNSFIVRFKDAKQAPRLVFSRRGLGWEMTHIQLRRTPARDS